MSACERELTGETPQERLSWWKVFSSGVAAMNGCAGRNFDTLRAVVPDYVTAMIAVASKSRAVVTAASQIALVKSAQSES